MDNEKLDQWAAKYIGEDEDTIGDAVASQWYTTSPGAAFVILNKCAAEGMDASVDISKGKVTVKCGEATETGDVDEIAKVIVAACYACHNG